MVSCKRPVAKAYMFEDMYVNQGYRREAWESSSNSTNQLEEWDSSSKSSYSGSHNYSCSSLDSSSKQERAEKEATLI